MNTKYLTIGIIALIVVGIGIFLYGYIIEPASTPKPTSGTEPQMAMSPYVEFEATVISLSLEDPEGYYEGNEIVRAPKDSAIVRIDKIIETGGPSGFDWSSIGIEEGKEVSLDFKYTVRPAKIITVVGETTRSGDAVSHQIVPTTISFEDNYFVFRENGNSETETILPGLQEGAKFRTKLWETEVKVGKYEIIS